MGSMEVRGEDVQQRSYWRCSKQDFLPEESFQNWSTCRTALSQTGHRFKNRLLSRSNDNDEIGELRKQSENDMKRCLTWWDLMWFGFGSVIGAGIFVLTGLETQRHAGPAIVLSYVASGLSAMLSVFCYTEFSIEIPVAGGAFAYLRIELGDFVAFITAGNILLESIVGSAGLARAWTSYFTALLNHPSNSLRIHTNLAEGFNLLDPIAVAVLVAVGALKGMTTVLLVGTLGQARYITHIARAHMIPPWFALVHPKTGTPINATVLIAISSSCIAFFSSLEVLTGLLSVSTLFIFMMMAVALLVRRYYVKDITPKHHLLKLVIFLLIIIASSMGTAAYWGLNPNGWVGYVVTVPLWFFGTLAMAVFLPQQRSPKLWGVPLVPWLPSLSIATNIFLMGSLGPEAFERFGICTVAMLIYYVFFGLHATYDVARKQDMPQESLVALCALKGMTTVLLVGTLGQARYITHIARAHMIPPWFSLVHPKTGTPINATVLIAISSGCIAFFTSLDILATLLSVSTLFIFVMMAIALLVRRYYVREITPQQHLLKLVIFLLIIIASSMGTSAYWGLNPNGRVGYVVTVPLWFFGTLAMAVFLPQQRSPKVWAVPLVPWLPSLSIAINIFLMGSLGPKAFERFGICTVIMLIYYVFFGLHATYDMAHKQDMRNP